MELRGDGLEAREGVPEDAAATETHVVRVSVLAGEATPDPRAAMTDAAVLVDPGAIEPAREAVRTVEPDPTGHVDLARLFRLGRVRLAIRVHLIGAA
jgi:hypothetical protein